MKNKVCPKCGYSMVADVDNSLWCPVCDYEEKKEKKDIKNKK